MLINGECYGWADITLLIGGVAVTGITAIEYDDQQEVVNKWGAGRYPVARGKGRVTCTAKITLEMSEVLAIQEKATNNRLQDIASFDVQVSYIPESNSIVHDIIKDCQFTTNARKWAEGDTNQSVELTLLPSKIIWGSRV